MTPTWQRFLTGVAIPVIVIIAGLAVTAGGQAQIKTFNAGEIFLIPGLGAGLVPEDDGLRIDFITPIEQRESKYQKVDLMKGDLVLMLNGKRVRTVAELQEQYDSVKVGEELKFGIKRRQAMMITSFSKPEAEQHGEQKVMMFSQTIGEEGEAPPPGMQVQRMELGGANAIALLEAGLILTDGGSGVEVMSILPVPNNTLSGDQPQKGDLIVSLLGKDVTLASEFRKLYDSVEDGTSIELVFTRGEKRHTTSFVKSSAQTGKPVQLKVGSE